MKLFKTLFMVGALSLSGMLVSPADSLGDTPPLRISNTVVHDSTNNRMIMFGGTSGGLIFFPDLWELDLGTMKWKEIEVGGEKASGRYDHSSIYDPQAERMIVFGGRVLEGQTKAYVDGAWVLDLKSMKWKKLENKENTPAARCKHTAIYDPDNDRMIVYGGKNARDQLLSDLWELDLKDMKWKEITIDGPKPSPRSNHTAIHDPVGQRMIVFGGEPKADRLWALDLKALKWKEIRTNSDEPSICREQTAVYDSTNKQMVICHGQDKNLIWGMDLSSMKWKKIDTKGNEPRVLEEHSAIYEPVKNRMIVFGGDGKDGGMIGLWEFDFKKIEWKEVK